MKNLLISLALAGPLSIAVTSSAAAEQASNIVRLSAPVSENAEQRINFTGELRMLSQRIPSAACYYKKGIEVETTSALLEGAPEEFEQILTALEFGDSALDIEAPEGNRKTLKLIHELRGHWEPMKEAVDAVASGTATPVDVQFALEQNEVVLEAAASLAPQLMKQYSNPNAVPHAQLMMIDLASRQRMLTQKMLKEACMLGTEAGTAAELQNTMSIFEASLEALRFGMPEVGIQPPPNDAIAGALEVVLKDWIDVKPVLVELLEGGDLDAPAITQKFNALNLTTMHMNTVVGLYSDAAGTGS